MTGTLAAPTAPGTPTVTTLANGLQVAVQRTPGSPGCGVAVNYRAGFRHEPTGRSGLAHLFEHLMFQGSRNVPGGRHFAEIQAGGGTVNGNTFTDVADFHQTAPLAGLARILELEADRMAYLELSQQTLDVQRRVVLEEINLQLRGRPYGGFPWTVLPAALYSTWPNAHNGFGSEPELEAATLADCRAFYDTHYAPGNAVVAVCADADPEDLVELVVAHFDDLPSRCGPPSGPRPEPHRGPLAVLDHRDPLAPRPAFAWGWRLPDAGARLREYAAYTVLSSLLTQGTHSVLRAALRLRNGLADTSVGLFGPFMAADPDTFVLVVHHDDGDRAGAEACVQEVLTGLAEDPDPEEIAAAVLRTASGFYQRLDSFAYRVRLLARGSLLFGRPDLAGEYRGCLEAITAHDVQRAAASLADPTRRATVHLHPGVDQP